MQLLSVIVPLYNESEVLPQSYARFTEVLGSLDCDYELIYVDDGSKDDTFAKVEKICADDHKVKALKFSRNFGHQLAVTAGMDAAKGDAAVIIDADLQDPPEIILPMLEKWREGYEVVYGKRLKREGETFLKKFTAFVYYRILDWLSPIKIPLDTGDFRLIDRSVLETMKKMREHNRFLRGMSAWAGYNACPVEYNRDERAAGKTKYTLKKMLKLAGDGIFGFSAKPLMLSTTCGIAVSFLTLLGALGALIALLLGAVVAGWLWAFMMTWLLLGIVLISIGITGTYISRMYDELKGRPLYIVHKTIN